MVKISFDLNEPKDRSNTDEAAQNGGTLKSVTFVIHHGGCFTPTPSRLNVLPFFRLRLGLNYGLHTLNVDADVLEMAKYVKDNKIILMYVEHESSNVDSSIFVTPKKGVAIAVDNHLRKAPIKIDSSPDPANYVEGPIVEEIVDDPFEDLNEILGDYANTGKQITRDKITGKQTVVHVEVEVDADNESEEESDIEGYDTSGSDSKDLDYDPKHDQVFDDDEHIVEDVPVSMNNFSFTADPRHDLSIGVVEVQEHDIVVIDYDSFGSNLDDGIDSKRRIQLRELKRIDEQKNKGPNKVRVRCEGTIPALVPYVASDTDMGKNVFSQKGGLFIRENNISGKQNFLGKDKTYHEKGKKVNRQKKEDNTYALGQCLWHTLMKADGRAVQDQMQKQFNVRVLKMKSFRAKRIATDSFREQYSLLGEYAQELINQNLGTTVRIDVQQQPNLESLTRTFRRVYVCLGALKQGFRACGREILGLDGCFMSGPWPGELKPIVTCFTVALGMKKAQASGGVGKREAIKNLSPLGS
nr:transposase, mutator type [Tanacetum cinerariifolium]